MLLEQGEVRPMTTIWFQMLGKNKKRLNRAESSGRGTDRNHPEVEDSFSKKYKPAREYA